MGVVKYLAPALSVASVAIAASCSAPTTTLVTGGDAAALAACSTFSGNIVIQTGAVVNNKLSLDGIQEIDGGIEYQNDNNVQTFSISTLNKITGPLNLNNLTQLSTIDLGNLDTAGNIIFAGLGSLGALGFGTPGLSQAGNVTIDNTQITSLDGISNATKLAGIDITDNGLLSAISLAVKEIGTLLVGPNDVSGTGGVSFDVPNLETVDTMYIKNCSSVKVPSLLQVTQLFGMIGNTYDSFTAPNLTWAGGLVIDDNVDMKNMSFPALTAVNGSNATLQVANNTKLMAISGFPVLKTVKGGINLFGNFSTASFPKISLIGGALNVDTASTSFDCTKLPSTGSSIVRGSLSCKAGDKNTPEGGSSTGSSSSATSSSFAYAQEIPSTFMPLFGILAGLLFA